MSTIAGLSVSSSLFVVVVVFYVMHGHTLEPTHKFVPAPSPSLLSEYTHPTTQHMWRLEEGAHHFFGFALTAHTIRKNELDCHLPLTFVLRYGCYDMEHDRRGTCTICTDVLRMPARPHVDVYKIV